MANEYVSFTCKAKFAFTGVKNKWVKEWLKKEFVKERGVYADIFNSVIDKLNSDWHSMYGDTNLYEDKTMWDLYNRFIKLNVQLLFDEANESGKGRFLNWYLDDECDMYARVKYLPHIKISMGLYDIQEES